MHSGSGPLEARSGPDPDKGETFRLTTVEVGTISGGHTYEVTLKSP
jgi:hypothetical protein